MYYDWKPYVPVGVRRQRAERAALRLQKNGSPCSPVSIAGRAIATTFWGRAWCDNIERYSDFYNRLERGRTYVRSGAVFDLQIAPGVVNAQVMGSRRYTVKVDIAAVPKARWSAVCKSCSGAIDSLVELLQGRFSKGVMEHICRKETGLFPAPKEIAFACSCPDWASMCKHVAAVLYGIGARLDEQPQLLFALRKVDEKDLIATAGREIPLAGARPAAGKRLDGGELHALFGIEMAEAAGAGTDQRTGKAAKREITRTGKKKSTMRKVEGKERVRRPRRARTRSKAQR